MDRSSNSSLRIILVVWGLSMVSEVGLVLVLGGFVFLLFTWPCFASEGSRLPSKWARFLGFLMHLALAMLSFLSTNKNKK